MDPFVRRDLALLREFDHMHPWRIARVRHDRHFSAASSFQIGVSRDRRTCSSGMLASVSQRWHLTCMLDSSEARAIVQAIISLGRGLNLEVVAEGVESHLQLAALTKKGCTHAQGYLFGRPMPIERFVGAALHKFSRASGSDLHSDTWATQSGR
jgi:hypothetical protein